MATELSRWLKIVCGFGLVIFGAIGHLVPLLPGGIFIAAGILLLADALPSVQRLVKRAESRYPQITPALRRVRRPDGSLDLSKVAWLLLAVSVVFGVAIYFVLPMIGSH